MSPQPNIDLAAAIAAIDRAVGLQASAVAFINTAGDQIKAAVKAALEADDAADQGTVDAALAAVDAKVAELNASSDKVADALAANAPA